MADNLVSPVGGVASVGESGEVARAARAAMEMTPNKPDPALGPVEAKPELKPENKPENKAKETGPEAAKHTAPTPVFENVRLHFRVDPKTHEVMVLMVDKTSRRVIRSIPPEELGKLKEGDLVELFA